MPVMAVLEHRLQVKLPYAPLPAHMPGPGARQQKMCAHLSGQLKMGLCKESVHASVMDIKICAQFFFKEQKEIFAHIF